MIYVRKTLPSRGDYPISCRTFKSGSLKITIMILMG